MLTLVTGLPGSGKTLLTLQRVKALAESDGRPVYYSGIADLKLPWVELDKPEEWFLLPANSIVVIDEAQRIFRPRGNGSVVPAHVAQLETHRHKGIDLFVITQHPMLLDANVRRLVGKHLHTVRTFGMKRATVHEWSECKPRCDESRADSIRHECSYPIEAFGWYKSAEVHTHKRNVPMRLWLLLVAPFLIVGLSWYAYVRVMAPATAVTKSAEKSAVPLAKGQTVAAGASTKSAQQWLQDRIPVIRDVPESAPVYQPLAVVRQFPMIAGCVSRATACTCYSQQGTKLGGISPETCTRFVRDGAFDAYKVEGKAVAAGMGGTPMQSSDAAHRGAQPAPMPVAQAKR